MGQGNVLTGVVTADPLDSLPVGYSIPLEPIIFGQANATQIPDEATDESWTFFEGALLAVVIRSGAQDSVVGTAAVIAPGIAVTATHILRDELENLIVGHVTIACMGPTSTGIEFWSVLKVSVTDADDIAYLSLKLGSAITPQWRFRSFPISTRAPRIGERLTAVGFRFADVNRQSEMAATFSGNLFVASGEVVNVYHPIRDRVLMPFPTIEVDCGALGGMSGGALLDEAGFLVGVISRSLETDDQRGPSYSAWIVGGLNRKVEIPWPPGVYPQSVHLLAIDDRALRIEGREKLTVVDPSNSQYEVWFTRPPAA